MRSIHATNGTIRIMPAPEGNGYVLSAGLVPKHSAGKKDKTPRPPNAFILYRQRHHPLLRAKYPTLHNNEICKWARAHVDVTC